MGSMNGLVVKVGHSSSTYFRFIIYDGSIFS